MKSRTVNSPNWLWFILELRRARFSPDSHTFGKPASLSPASQLVPAAKRAPRRDSVPRHDFPRRRIVLGLGLALALFGLSRPVQAQLPVSDNFNDGNDLGWTSYEGNPGTREIQFPADPAGGFRYRIINHAAMNESGVFTRGGSIRNDVTYGDQFFVGTDVITWDDTAMVGLAGTMVLARLTPGQIAPGSTTGYLVGYLAGGPLNPMGLLGFIEFQSELTATYPDETTGGFSLTPKLDPTKGYRIVFKSGPGPNGGLLIGEIYDRFDLLEPMARSVARDDANFSVHPAGPVGIGNLNVGAKDTVDWTGSADTTFDNFYAAPNSNNFVGFVGVAQVANLKPAPQTLFYKAPGLGSNITFNVTTYNTTQIDTNLLKVFLNGADVSSQLVITEVGVPTTKTNYSVRYTGALASNTVYQGQIRVVDTTGKGTTNNWFFDTFGTNGIVTIEAEDYNYTNGLFIDNPPVSGVTPDTVIIGLGSGYYNLTGTEEVDYHDSHVPGGLDAGRNQYRTADFVGTTQARVQRDMDVRQQYIDADVGEYFVTYLNTGEWMNYTRTFPSGNYQVYLRASSQKAQAMQLDEVTAGSTTTSQTTAIRGLFLVPKTGGSSRFRYVPLTDAGGNIQTLSLAGVRTLRLTDLESSQKNTLDVGDVQVNYLLLVPATAAPQRAFVASASPAGGTVMFDPEGTAQISIVNRATSVSAVTSVKFDGVNVTGSATINITGTGASISYKPASFLLPNSTHTLEVTFADGSGSQTVPWSFTVRDMPTLLPSDREITGPDSVFTVKVHKGQNADPTTHTVGSFNNNISRAERQLAGTLGNSDTPGFTFMNEIDPNNGFAALTFTEPTAIHYEQCGGSTPLFGTAKLYPGIAPPVWDCGVNGDPNHFAMAASIKLSLAAGVYRMGFDADDEVVVQAGPAGTNFQGFALTKILGSSETLPGEREDDSTGVGSSRVDLQACKLEYSIVSPK